MVRHGCERQGYLCPFAGVHDCTICDEAGGCGRIGRFFPLSMSDFKPGDKDTPVSYTHLDVYKRQVLVCLLRYACHFLSGITVWRDISIPMAGAVPFSLIYNATYMLPETIITVLGAFMIGGVLDFRREMVGRAPKQERQPLSAVILFAAATVLFLAGLVFDTAHIFSHLQNPDTGVFDITGITGCNWTLVITVTAVALVLSGAALIIRKVLLSRQRLPLRRSPEQK